MPVRYFERERIIPSRERADTPPNPRVQGGLILVRLDIIEQLLTIQFSHALWGALSLTSHGQPARSHINQEETRSDPLKFSWIIGNR
jgi:hypothetical protein